MIWQLAKKEVLTKILDFRFMISSVIALCLVVLTTVILSEQYNKRVDEYNEFVRSDKEALNDVKVFSQLRLNVHRPPTPLSIFNKGVSWELDSRMPIRHSWVPRQGVEASVENPFMKIFQFFDLTTIFMIIFSLLAILMVYDAVSGEREEGTLKAMLSNSVGRYQILTSKLFASLVGLAIPVLLSLLVSLIIMMLFFGVTFNAEHWLRVGLIVLSTFLFLTFFVTVGLFVSSRVRQASVSLIWLLFIWVLVVIVQPNLSSYMASTLVSIPPRERIDAAERQIREELGSKAEQIQDDLNQEVPDDTWYSNHTYNLPYYHSFDGNKAGLYRYVLLTRRLQPIVVDLAEREWQVYKAEYGSHLDRQYRCQSILDRFSPASLFDRITASLAQTDINHFESFLEQARNYRHSYVSYMKDERKVFSDNANLYFTCRTMEEIMKDDYEERRAARRRGENAKTYGPDDYPPLELASLPQFELKYPSTAKSLQAVVLDLLMLVVCSVLVFYLCTTSFNRYDVRSD